MASNNLQQMWRVPSSYFIPLRRKEKNPSLQMQLTEENGFLAGTFPYSFELPG